MSASGSTVIEAINPRITVNSAGMPMPAGMMHHKKSHTGMAVVVAIGAILLLTLFIWLLIFSLKWKWFLSQDDPRQVDGTKAFLVSLGIAILIVIIIGIIMYFARSNKC